jgi:hypothetical protein
VVIQVAPPAQREDTLGGGLKPPVLRRGAYGGHNGLCRGISGQVEPRECRKALLRHRHACDVLSFKSKRCFLHASGAEDFYTDAATVPGAFVQTVSGFNGSLW